MRLRLVTFRSNLVAGAGNGYDELVSSMGYFAAVAAAIGEEMVLGLYLSAQRTPLPAPV